MIPGTIKLRSIVLPCKMGHNFLVDFQDFVRTHFVPTLKVLYPDVKMMDALWESPMDFMKGLRASPFLLPKSSPTVLRAAPDESEISPRAASSPSSIVHAAYLWISDPLYPFLKNWLEMTGNTWVINRMEQWTKGYDPAWRVRYWSPGTTSLKVKMIDAVMGSLGKLGYKEEAAGKTRVFAIVDPWTQWIMRPLHDGIGEILRLIPQDGTYDQLAPLERLKKLGSEGTALYSFDLKSATDRLPLTLQKVLLSPFLTNWGAELWGILLTGRPYQSGLDLSSTDLHGLKEGNFENGNVWYGAGQPMGALSSWNMLALTHHALVQFAAYRAGVITNIGGWFQDYAVLGDDLVIAGHVVAKSYLEVMRHADVAIDFHKSLVSMFGSAMEFAKRYIWNGYDVSANPLPELQAARVSLTAWLEYCKVHSLTLAQGLSILGYRYRALSTLKSRLFSLPSRLRGYIVAWHGPSGPSYVGFKEWLMLRSIDTQYKTPERVGVLIDGFLDREIKRLMKRLDDLAPLIKVAKDLGTVYRDREHYGTKAYVGERFHYFTDMYHFDEWMEYPRIVDSITETVYREPYLDSVITARDLRNQIEEMNVQSFTWGDMEDLWIKFDEFETEIASLPLPKDLYGRPEGRLTLGSSYMVLKRWNIYSSTFRKTTGKGPSL